MHHLHIASGNEYKGLQSIAQVAYELEHGNLNPEDKYWLPGMASWAPLSSINIKDIASWNQELPEHSEIEALRQILPPVLPEATSKEDTVQRNAFDATLPVYELARDHDPLSARLSVLLWLNLAMASIILVLNGCLLGSFSMEASERILMGLILISGLFEIAAGLLFLVTSVFFVKWTVRAAKNARNFNPDADKIKPIMAGFSYFIPFANMILPYIIMQRIWRVSCDPLNSSTQPENKTIANWWMYWVLGALASLWYNSRQPDEGPLAGDPEAVKTRLIVLTFSSFFSIMNCFYASRMVQVVTHQQNQLAGKKTMGIWKRA